MDTGYARCVIHYLVAARHAYTMELYLATWGVALRDTIRVLSYEELACAGHLEGGTYIFADLDVAGARTRAIARLVRDRLDAAPIPTRVLNDPSRSRDRLELLTALAGSGLNEYRAYRLEDAGRARFPVFVRSVRDHSGSIGDLAWTWDDLRAQVAVARLRSRARDLIVVEFVETRAADGYRKYAAFRVGDRIVPRHLIFGPDWLLKDPTDIDADKLREEREYLERNPHRGWIEEVFRLARVEYGRIDYGMYDGRPQAWEINPNPLVMMAPERYQKAHVPHQVWFAERIAAAFRAIDLGGEGRVAFDTGRRPPSRSRLALRRAADRTWQVTRNRAEVRRAEARLVRGLTPAARWLVRRDRLPVGPLDGHSRKPAGARS